MTPFAPDPATAKDGILVLETWTGEAYLGQLSFRPDHVVVHTGHRGRPRVVARDEVQAILPAAQHHGVILDPPHPE